MCCQCTTEYLHKLVNQLTCLNLESEMVRDLNEVQHYTQAQVLKVLPEQKVSKAQLNISRKRYNLNINKRRSLRFSTWALLSLIGRVELKPVTSTSSNSSKNLQLPPKPLQSCSLHVSNAKACGSTARAPATPNYPWLHKS